ncbi:hypothetical protein BDQ17DRAFT_1430155 [Cyathus striatus]|nr:hypothetical protein BDQ17DRAFT_1430155 [Cyathus striatus]
MAHHPVQIHTGILHTLQPTSMLAYPPNTAAEFPIELVLPSSSFIIYHPEYNSTLILRSSMDYKSFYAAEGEVRVVVLTPVMEEDRELPYYHPSESHLAFRFIPSPSSPPSPPSPTSSTSSTPHPPPNRNNPPPKHIQRPLFLPRSHGSIAPRPIAPLQMGYACGIQEKG